MHWDFSWEVFQPSWGSHYRLTLGNNIWEVSRGVISPIIIVVSSFSPLLGGISWSEESSYKSAFVMFGAAWIKGGLLPLTLGKPKPPHNQDSEIAIAL